MKTPFGSTVAAIRLAQMVEQDSKSRKYVSSTLSEFNNLLLETCGVKDVKTARHLYMILRTDFIRRIESAVIPPKVKSYLRNVLTSNFNRKKRSMEWVYASKRKLSGKL